VFGVSFPEFLVLGTVALLVLGPEKLPGMLRTLGQWLAKLRKLTTEVRNQSGIDDVLRAEGFDGGLNELRSIMRGGAPAPAYQPPTRAPALAEHFVPDKSREYPPEGPDASGALPEDLVPGAVPPAGVPPAGVLPDAGVPPTGVLPDAAGVPSTGVLPDAAGVVLSPEAEG
jgi:sec-independent protein translocase protein TatB